jgi:hypothetical protein
LVIRCRKRGAAFSRGENANDAVVERQAGKEGSAEPRGPERYGIKPGIGGAGVRLEREPVAGADDDGEWV